MTIMEERYYSAMIHGMTAVAESTGLHLVKINPHTWINPRNVELVDDYSDDVGPNTYGGSVQILSNGKFIQTSFKTSEEAIKELTK